MEYLTKQCRGLEGLTAEEMSRRLRQNQLFVYLNNNITTPVLQNIKQLLTGIHLGDRELESCETPYDILNALHNRCVITVGRYEKLKELLKDAGVKKLVKDVEKAEYDIEEISRRVFHDDPSHVKALKEHYDDTCSALRKGSTLADVTEVLKRHKILDFK